MPVHEVQGLNDFHTQLRNPKKLVVSYFGAHWCGPCKMYGPMFDAMAGQNPQAHFIKVYEDANRDVIAEQGVRAYPTTKIFVEGTVKGEVRGANAPEVQRIVQELQGSMFHAFGGSGATLGGGGATASAEDARAARLKRFAAPAKPNPWLDAAPATTPIESGDAKMDVCGPDGCPPEAGSNPPDILAEDDELQAAIAMSMSDAAETGDSGEAKEGGEAAMDEEDTELTQGVGKLLLEMGFNEVRSRKALRSAGAGADLDACVNWLMEHQDDEDIDDPATLPPKPMPKKELTPAERAAKMEAVQKRMAERRREREEAEKAADINRESDRRQMGKDMQVRREEMQRMARKREAEKARKEKMEARAERERILAELERDKRERAANNGKLGTRLGVEGFRPSGVDYGPEGAGENAAPAAAAAPPPPPAPITRANAPAVIDQCISSIQQYRAGGDGGKALDLLTKIVQKMLENPGETKFERLNMDGKAYKSKIKPFIGGLKLMQAIGFEKVSEDGGNHLVMQGRDDELLGVALGKLQDGLRVYKTRR